MDTIADMLTMIRNAQAVKSKTVSTSYSKFKMEVAKALARGNFIKEASHKGKKNKRMIEIILGYDETENSRIRNIKKISKLSRRVYIPFSGIKPVKQRLGALILSTPKGVLTGKEAKKEKVGGEVICEVW